MHLYTNIYIYIYHLFVELYRHIWLWADRIWPILPLFFVAFASSPQAMAGGNVQVEGWPGGRVTPHFFWRNEMKFHGKSPKSGDFWLRKKKIRVSWNADWDSKILILILGWNVYSISSWWVQIFTVCSPLFGEDSHFDYYFSNGLKNHQPDIFGSYWFYGEAHGMFQWHENVLSLSQWESEHGCQPFGPW